MRVAIMFMTVLVPLTMAWSDTKVDSTKPAQPDGDIEIKIVTGSLKITGWDRNEIRVQGTLGDDVEKFIFEIDGDDAEIRVVLPKRRRGRVDRKARLEINVPRGSSIQVSVVSAPIELRGLSGDDIEVEAVSGKITIDDCRGDVDVETVSGSILIDGHHASVRVEAVSGTITIRGVSDEVDVETVSGSIDIEGAALRECKIEVLSGRVKYQGGLAPDGELDIEAFSGSVEIIFTNEVAGRYRIETFSGRIQNSFGPEPRKKNRFGPGYELDFTHGDGDAEIQVNTFSGSVTLRTR